MEWAPQHRRLEQKVLAVVTANRSGIAPILELCRILHSRGHIIEFATLTGQQNLVIHYPFITCVHFVGPAITLQGDKRRSMFWKGHDRATLGNEKSPTDMLGFLRSGWSQTYMDLRDLVKERRHDFILADWQDEPAVKSLIKQQIPIAVMWSQMAWMGERSPEIYSGLLMSGFDRLRRTMTDSCLLPKPAPLSNEFFGWRKRVHRDGDTQSATIRSEMPKYMSFVNSFFGLNLAQDLPPLVEMIGPILAETFPPLTHELESFLQAHHRVLYITLGDPVSYTAFSTQQIIEGVATALEKHHIDGAIWATESLTRSDFFDVFEDLFENRDPDWRFLPFAPQRAILAHASTRLFLSQCGTSSLNEAVYHGVPILAFDTIHALNAQHAELVWIAQTLPHPNINALQLCEKIGEMIHDVYGSIHRNMDYLQGIAIVNANRKELAADIVEKVLFDRDRHREESSGSGRALDHQQVYENF